MQLPFGETSLSSISVTIVDSNRDVVFFKENEHNVLWGCFICGTVAFVVSYKVSFTLISRSVLKQVYSSLRRILCMLDSNKVWCSPNVIVNKFLY